MTRAPGSDSLCLFFGIQFGIILRPLPVSALFMRLLAAALGAAALLHSLLKPSRLHCLPFP